VNRLSLGIQALNDPDLRFLGRLHDARAALSAIDLARGIFPRISFDLIYARPHQTPEAWAAELRKAIDHAADHLSLYQLTMEEGTPFGALHHSGRLLVPDPQQAAELYEVTQEICASGGLPAYEVSNHARPGAECRHNLIYWRYGEYAGIGPGAHGRLDLEDGRHATAAIRQPETWLSHVEERGHGDEVDERLSPEQQADEYLLTNMRLAEGLDLAAYEAVSGRGPGAGVLADLAGMGLVVVNAGRVRATRRGFLVLNSVVAGLAA
jgi:oxygen-independent coproporphyrinogen-3 oxidase